MTQVDDAPARGISRRDLLRRGAVVGATAAWTVPLVQVVSMTPAHADSPSAPPVNPPPMTTPDTPPPPITSSAPPSPPSTPKPPPHQPADAHKSTASSAPAVVPAADVTPAADATALANTGATYPVMPTVGVGAAAIALGAGALTAAHALKRKQDSAPDA